MITGVGAVVNTAAMPHGASVAVVGLGGVGLAALLAARMLEAEHIVAIDMNEAKLAVARKLGATRDRECGRPRLRRAVRELTRGGVAFAFEMAGLGTRARSRLSRHAPRRHDGVAPACRIRSSRSRTCST